MRMDERKICPSCGKSHYGVGVSCRTLMYFQPVIKDGVNINPDRNITSTELHCQECGKTWVDKE